MTPDPTEESRTIDTVGACPSEDDLLGLLSGDLDGEVGVSVRAHLLSCVSCQDVVGELAGGTEARPTARLDRGDSVGRYLVLGVRGAGAMGVVYEAFDPELARKVALKLVRADRDDRADVGLHARLLREAQAMAKLSHPNVIAVHDVGTVGDEVFVAMELVDGGTLTEHLRAHTSEREVLDAFVQAGRGLAAAHAAGLVHRDFKPDNVLVGADGRVRVTDFGLARWASPDGNAPELDDAPLIAATLTRTGAAVGTPAYMAPEVIAGGRPDARADIYGFSVALYEALAGVRPFTATTMGGLRDAIMRGEVKEPARKMPPRLRTLVKKGLAADPEKRWATMGAMLAELERRPRRTTFAVAAVAAATLAIGGVAWAAQTTETCASGDAAWADVWNGDQRARVKQAFERTSVAFAADALAGVDAALTTRGREWMAMHTDACTATRVRHEQSEAMRDRKFACLDTRRASTRALVRLLADADAELVARAAGAVKSLPPLDDCANAAALGSAPQLPPSERPRARAVLDQLSEAQALRAAGRYAPGLVVAERANEAAKTIADPHLKGSALVTRGLLLEELMRYDDAERAYHEAARTALPAQDHAVAADAWLQLAGIAGYRREQVTEAHVWMDYAGTAIAGLGHDRRRLAKLYERRSLVEWSMEGKLEEANDDYAKSMALERGLPLSEATRFREEQGGVQFDMGRYDVAEQVFAREVERLMKERGADHPEMLEAAENLAEARQMMGRASEAIPVYRELLARFSDRALGYTNHRLADALRRVGEPKAALVEDEIAIANEIGPDDGIARGPGHHGKGVDLWMLGRTDEALVSLERAARIRSHAKLPTTRAETDFALARALDTKGGAQARAVSLATSARDAYREAAARYGSRWYGEEAAQIDRWLREHAR